MRLTCGAWNGKLKNNSSCSFFNDWLRKRLRMHKVLAVRHLSKYANLASFLEPYRICAGLIAVDSLVIWVITCTNCTCWCLLRDHKRRARNLTRWRTCVSQSHEYPFPGKIQGATLNNSDTDWIGQLEWTVAPLPHLHYMLTIWIRARLGRVVCKRLRICKLYPWMPQQLSRSGI